MVATPRGAALPFTAGVTAVDATAVPLHRAVRPGARRPCRPPERIRGLGPDPPTRRDGWADPAGGSEPIRIGRVTGDIVDRNKTDLYPTVQGVRAYLTTASDLAISCPVS